MRTLGSRSLRAGLALLVLVASTSPLAYAQQKVYACPQPDGPVRYQDRPCAAMPPVPAVPKASASAAVSAVVSPSFDGPPPAAAGPEGGADFRTESRADYLARNVRRCDAGDRRACVSVTCERSGGLGTKSCQAALGYRRGAGWDLRPATDVFDPARREDEYALRCTQQARRARVLASRDGGDARVYTGEGEPTSVPLESIADFAQRWCAAR